MTTLSNVLGITDPDILQKYKEIIKIKFLIHVATSMFINQEAEFMLHDVPSLSPRSPLRTPSTCCGSSPNIRKN
jgi:hypothetical protein